MLRYRVRAALPNALSLARLLLGLAFPFWPVSWRVPVVVVAAITDMLDGAASRHWHVTSVAGRLLDPLADKVFVIGVVGTFWYEGALDGWQIVLVGLRDFVVIAGVLWLLWRRNWAALKDMPPMFLGKLTTAAQLVYFVDLLLWPDSAMLIFWPTAALSALTAAQYFHRFRTRR